MYDIGRATVAAGTGNLITETAIRTYEQEARRPTGPGILAIALSYGLSTDWIFGVSDIPYTKSSIKVAVQKYKDDYNNENLGLRPDADYTLEAVGNILAIKRFLKVLSRDETNKDRGKGIRLRRDLKTVIETGRPVYELASSLEEMRAIEEEKKRSRERYSDMEL